MELKDVFKIFNGNKTTSKINNVIENIKQKPKKEDAIVDFVEYRQPEMFGITLNDWKNSVQVAWSEIDCNRVELADIYKAMTSYDSQTMTAIQQRKLLTMQGELAIYNQDGSVNEEYTKLIKSPSGATKLWFRDFISMCLDAIFWGYELIAIDIKDGKIIVRKIPERNVIPNKGLLLLDAQYPNSSNNSIKYNDGGKLDLITCKISYTNDLNDLGLLNGCAPYFFSKVTGSWKAHADKFGMLTRVLKTNSENKNKMTASYNMLKNQVRGNFIILGENDQLTFEGDTRTQLPYKELNDYCDASISKIILGQTSTTDQKSFAGSAGVHQDILNSIIKSDREFIEAIVNDQLIPKLQMFGLLPQGLYFGISATENVDLVQMATIVKTLNESGHKVTSDYIKKTFGVDLVENVITTENNNTNI